MQTTREMAAPLPGRPMLHALAKSWWLLLLRGIAAIIFGILAFVWPGLTLVTLVLLYGAFALVDGVISLIAAFTGSAKPVPTWWLVVVGCSGSPRASSPSRGLASRRSFWCCSSAPGHWCTAFSRSSAQSSCARRSTTNGC